jgi:hypothetical protein
MQHKYYKHGCLLFKEVGGEDGISFPFFFFFIIVDVQTSLHLYRLILQDLEINNYIRFMILKLIIFNKQTKNLTS